MSVDLIDDPEVLQTPRPSNGRIEFLRPYIINLIDEVVDSNEGPVSYCYISGFLFWRHPQASFQIPFLEDWVSDFAEILRLQHIPTYAPFKLHPRDHVFLTLDVSTGEKKRCKRKKKPRRKK